MTDEEVYKLRTKIETIQERRLDSQDQKLEKMDTYITENTRSIYRLHGELDKLKQLLQSEISQKTIEMHAMVQQSHDDAHDALKASEALGRKIDEMKTRILDPELYKDFRDHWPETKMYASRVGILLKGLLTAFAAALVSVMVWALRQGA